MTRSLIANARPAFLTPVYGAPGQTSEVNRVVGYYSIAALAPWMPRTEEPASRPPLRRVESSLLRF